MTGYNNCHPNAEHERDRAQVRLYSSLPMTAASAKFFQVIHAGDGKSNKPTKKKTKSKAKGKAKKPDSQKKVKHFFQTKVNEDGYPMHLCEYEPTERRHIYRPPGYGDNKENRWFHDGSHCTNCHLKPCITFEYYSETNDFFFDQNISKKKSVSSCVDGVTKLLQKFYCKVLKRRYLKKEIPPACIRDRVEALCNYADEEKEESNAESSLSVDSEAIEVFCKKTPGAYWDESIRIPFHIFYKNKRFKDEEQKRLACEELLDSESDSDSSSDEDDDDFPLSVLRDHQNGDLSIEEKIAHYRTKQAQQKVVFKQNNRHTTEV